MPITNFQGPFTTPKLLGATVADFSISANWGEQSTYADFTIVEDPNAGDSYVLKDENPSYANGGLVGTPASFQYESFRFDGIIKSSDQVKDFQGNPTYRLVLVSPVEILDSAQVILDGYIGPANDSLFNSVPQGQYSFRVSNLFNIYGYAESGGSAYGRSQITDIGLPWTGQYGIQAILEILTNTPPPANDINTQYTNYGSYINYKDRYYRLDLSNLPVPPTYYRLGGVTNMSLMELLSKFFQDAGVDYIVKLTMNDSNDIGPHTISFITVPRYVQQPLGFIQNYIQSQSAINAQSHGQELRSDITQAFLVGGALQLLQTETNENSLDPVIIPFWGFDVNGQPIIGQKVNNIFNFVRTVNGDSSIDLGPFYADDDHYMLLNASNIADIMGEVGTDADVWGNVIPALSYPCTIFEMRCALGNYNTWEAFICIFKKGLADRLRMYGMWQLNPNFAIFSTVWDILNDQPGLTQRYAEMFQANHFPAVAQRLYNFVREQAEKYYGKQFLVKLPFNVQVKIDSTTGVTSFNNELTDAGFVPEGSDLLGLSPINENYFMNQDGRFFPFVRFVFSSLFTSIGDIYYQTFNGFNDPLTGDLYQHVLAPDASYTNQSTCVTQYNTNTQYPYNSYYSYIYMQCQQGVPGPTFVNGNIGGGSPIFFVPDGAGNSVPAMVVTIGDAIWAQAEDVAGSVRDLSALLQTPLGSLRSTIAQRNTSFNLVVHPPAYYPDSIAVALKSNQYVYGPWGQFNKNGKVEFEQDEGLVPWEYGGYDLMNQAAIAKLNTIAKGNQILERGSINEAGIPRYNIGDILVDGGPIITSVKCEINPREVTTQYNMQTFVNRAGAFVIENAERLRRIGKIYQQMRRSIRQLIIERTNQSLLFQSNYRGFMYGTSYAIEQRTPHGVISANLVASPSGTYIPQSWTQTPQESLATLGGITGAPYLSTACVGMEALFRGYTYNSGIVYLEDSDTSFYMGRYAYPDSGNVNFPIDVTQLITSIKLNPIQQDCDINWLTYGDEYEGIKVSNGQTDFTNARSIGLRGPIVMQSWGYDFYGKPVPNDANPVDVYGDESVFIPNPYNPLSQQSDRFWEGVLSESINWPTGPIDLRWNKFTGTWMSPGMILWGNVSGSIGPQSFGAFNLMVNGRISNDVIQVFHNLTKNTSAIPDGTRCSIGYDPLNNRWNIIVAEC